MDKKTEKEIIKQLAEIKVDISVLKFLVAFLVLGRMFNPSDKDFETLSDALEAVIVEKLGDHEQTRHVVFSAKQIIRLARWIKISL